MLQKKKLSCDVKKTNENENLCTFFKKKIKVLIFKPAWTRKYFHIFPKTCINFKFQFLISKTAGQHFEVRSKY